VTAERSCCEHGRQKHRRKDCGTDNSERRRKEGRFRATASTGASSANFLNRNIASSFLYC
jgi:hypothetical protein